MVKPTAVSYFQKASESRTHALRKMIDQGINTFVIMDDSSYTGNQIENTINQVADLYKSWGIAAVPKFIVVVPFVTDKAIETLSKAQEGRVVLLYSREIQRLSTILSEDEIRIMNEQRGESRTTTGPLYDGGSTITYFDHRLADEFSFAEDIGSLFDLSNFRKPYDMPETDYYKEEEESFETYFNPNTSAAIEDSAMQVENTGGIDFKSDKVDSAFEVKMDSHVRGNDKDGIKFHIDPAMLEQLQNAPGFVPVIINIQPMTDLRGFLGLHNVPQSQESPALH